MSAVGGVIARRARAGLVGVMIFLLFGVAGTPVHAENRLSISVLVPIVAVESSSELLTLDEIVESTQPGGAWRELSAAAIAHGATIALDSRITASIDALGDAAPPSVVAWRSDVLRTRPVILPWANADPFVLAAIGQTNRVSAIALGEIAGVPTADIVGWPSGRAGSDRSVGRMIRLGYSSFIVDDHSFPSAPRALSAKLNAMIRDAVSPQSSVDVARAAADLRNAVSPGTQVSLPRNPHDLDVSRSVRFLDALFAGSTESSRFVPTPVEALGNFVATDIPENAIRSLMAQHRKDRRVSTIAVDPTVISVPRLRKLCVIAGQIDQPNFPSLVRVFTRDRTPYDEFVSFSLGTDFTVLANSTQLPLTVTNSSASDITVIASVTALSGIVSISEPNQEVVVPAGTSMQVLFPLTSVANGSTSLRAMLTTVDGLAISEPVFVDIDVQAQWEGLTLFGFVTVVSIVMGLGIVRTIRDRRARA